jgi:hypothetical protein
LLPARDQTIKKGKESNDLWWREDLGLLGLEFEVELLNHRLEELRVPWNLECLVFGYRGLAALEA